jgi:hypothetical protein
LSQLLQWIYDRLDVIAYIFAIPWGMFLASVAITGWKKLTDTSGADIFVILTSLDLEFIVFKEKFSTLVYSKIQSKFTQFFVIAFIVSFIFLALSCRAQRRIERNKTRNQEHPTGLLIVCWTVALAWMGIHFFAILAR